jgi:hypothetical protein
MTANAEQDNASLLDVRLRRRSAGRHRAARQKRCGGGSSKPINDALRALVFDVDRADGDAARNDVHLPAPSYAIRNPDNGHA